jgi:hypothetical protein
MGANLQGMERCFECFVIKDDETSPGEETEVSAVSKEERNTVLGESEYLRDLINSSCLEVLKKNLVQRVCEGRNEKGAVHLMRIQFVAKLVPVQGPI